MNYSELIRRAFNITLRNKHLWLLGFLAALAQSSGGLSFNSSGNGLNNFNRTSNWPPAPSAPDGGVPGVPDGMPDMSTMFNEVLKQMQANSAMIVTVVLALFCAGLLIGLVLMLLAEIGEGGLIHNVNLLDAGNPSLMLATGVNDPLIAQSASLAADDAQTAAGPSVTLGGGWRAGTARLRPLIAQRLLLAAPGFAMGLLALVTLVAGLAPLVRELIASGATADAEAMMPQLTTLLLSWSCVLIPLGCIGFIYSLFAAALSTYGRRLIMLENTGAIDSLKRSWALLRDNFSASFIVALIVVVISAVVGLVLAAAALALVIPVGLGLFGSLRDNTFDPVMLLPMILGGALLTVLSVFVNSILTALRSSFWTLAYRSLARRQPAITSSTTQPPL